MILKLVWSELKNTKKFSLFFILNFALGVFGFVALEYFKDSLDTTVQLRSKAVLGADLGLSARRPLTEDELAKAEEEIYGTSQKSDYVEVFSMVANRQGRSSLVQVKAIDDHFPFYGEIALDKKKTAVHSLNSANITWVYPEILQIYKVKLGDSLKVGQKEFVIAGVVTDDSASGISTNMAPRIYIGRQFLKDTALIQPGSLAWHSRVYKLRATKQEIDATRERIFKTLPAEDLQVFTHEGASEQMGRLLNYLNDFLGLASLIAMFVASIGIGFLTYSYFKNQMRSIAILRSLGFTPFAAVGVYALRVLILGMVSSLIACIFAFTLLPLFQRMAAQFVDFKIIFVFEPVYIALSLLIGIAGSLLTVLPLALRLRHLSPTVLLQPFQVLDGGWDRWSALAFAPSLLTFYWLCVRQTHSYYNGSIFFGAFAGSVLIFFVVGYFTIPVLEWLARTPWLSLNWALRDLSRLRFSTLTAFLAISLGVLLLNLIPQVEASLKEEIRNPESSKVPSLFLFDIQPEQVAELQRILQEHQVPLRDLSPLVRARLKSINGKPFDKGVGRDRSQSREEERELQARNRGFNLSYRESLSVSETLLEGEPLPKEAPEGGAIPQISVEERFAGRLGIKIGDRLTFDIQDIPVEGQIANLRKVQWTSFQPNFFILFQPGVLEEAPKTFLATLPKMPLDEKVDLQDDVVRALPNISMVDVGRLVEKLQQLVQQMSWALTTMSVLTLLVGFSVLFSIVNYQSHQRRWDIGLLKTLGATPRTILAALLLQFSMIVGFAALIGFMVSLAVSYLISQILFDKIWVFNFATPVLIGLGSLGIALIVTWWASSRALQTKPTELLS